MILGALILLVALATSCGGAASPGAGPLARWNFDAPARRVELPRALREVSGLAVTPDGRLFAHDDELAALYQVDPETGVVVKRFAMGRATKGDFEGAAVTADGTFVLVTSQGLLYFSKEGKDGEEVPFTTVDSGAGGACEVEGLAAESADVLLLACKTPVKKALTVFRWSIAARRAANPSLVSVPIPKQHPSAIERDPSTGTWLLLASKEGTLLEVNEKGVALGIQLLDRRRHPQPEGLTILPDGRLAIADEGGKHAGTLTVYARR